jgi:hypothetical protein
LALDPLNCEGHQLVAATDIQLFLNVGAVRLDGLDAAIQFRGDFAGTKAESEQVQDLEFPFRKAKPDARRFDCPTVRETCSNVRHPLDGY